MSELLKPNVQIGQTVLRRKGNGGDFDTWVECYVNETYHKLINEFPDDYRQLDGSPFEMVANPNKWPLGCGYMVRKAC
jgi:hypothetical protein